MSKFSRQRFFLSLKNPHRECSALETQESASSEFKKGVVLLISIPKRKRRQRYCFSLICIAHSFSSVQHWGAGLLGGDVAGHRQMHGHGEQVAMQGD